MNLLLWLAQYSTAILCGVGALVGLMGLYLAVKRERGERWTPPRTRYPRRK